MYNVEQKQRYLNYCAENVYEESTILLLERIFNSTEMEEEQFNKDVSEFNQIEVTDLLKSFNSSSPARLRSTCTYLREYYNWCYEEGLVDSIINPFDDRVTNSIVDMIIPKEDLNDKFFTKEKLIEEYMTEVPDVSNKFILYALFSGFNIKELTHLKLKDLDFDKSEVNLITGRAVKVDDRFKNLMIDTDSQTQYFEDGIEKESKFKKYDYGESQYVLKTCGVKECGVINEQIINVRLRTIKKQTGNKFFTVTNLNKNGLVNYIKEQYAKKDIDLRKAFFDEINKHIYTYDKETQQYIYDFGSQATVKMLRMEIKNYIDLL